MFAHRSFRRKKDTLAVPHTPPFSAHEGQVTAAVEAAKDMSWYSSASLHWPGVGVVFRVASHLQCSWISSGNIVHAIDTKHLSIAHQLDGDQRFCIGLQAVGFTFLFGQGKHWENPAAPPFTGSSDVEVHFISLFLLTWHIDQVSQMATPSRSHWFL